MHASGCSFLLLIETLCCPNLQRDGNDFYLCERISRDIIHLRISWWSFPLIVWCRLVFFVVVVVVVFKTRRSSPRRVLTPTIEVLTCAGYHKEHKPILALKVSDRPRRNAPYSPYTFLNPSFSLWFSLLDSKPLFLQIINPLFSTADVQIKFFLSLTWCLACRQLNQGKIK